MSDFEAKMHQNRFRLGLPLRLRWGSLQRSPSLLVGIKGTYFYGKRRSKGKAGEGEEKKGGGNGWEMKEVEGTPCVPLDFLRIAHALRDLV